MANNNPGNPWSVNFGAPQAFPGTSSGWNHDRDQDQPQSTSINDTRAEPHDQIKFQDVVQRLETLGIDAETLLTQPKAWKLANNYGIQILHPNEPTDYLLYINRKQKLTSQVEVIFYVQTVNLQKKTLPQTPNFRITVDTPRGHTAFVRILKDHVQPNRFICSFRAVYRGDYTIRGMIGTECIMGSPVIVSIWSKNDLTDPGPDTVNIMDNLTKPTKSKENFCQQERIFSSPSSVLQMLDDGPRNLKPWGIAAHPFTQQIFVTDRDAHEVCSYSFQNHHFQFLFKFGQSGLRCGHLKRPTGIAVDVANHRLIIADKDNHRICFFQFNGTFLMSFGEEGRLNGQFKYPWGVAVSPNGTLIAVTDSRNHRIQLFNGSGVYLNKFAPVEETPNCFEYIFNSPRGITFDNIGMAMYVTDFKLEKVLGFSLDFRVRRSLTPSHSELRHPQGIAVNSAGNIVVCDTRNDSIRIISPTGILIQTLTLGGPDAEKVGQPLDVAACAGDRLFILEACGRICIIDAGQQRRY